MKNTIGYNAVRLVALLCQFAALVSVARSNYAAASTWLLTALVILVGLLVDRSRS